jgi:membrane-associated protein
MFDVDSLIRSGGIILISLIIFAESGLLIGFFLPGDTLLFAAGLAASNGQFSLPILLIAVILAAIIGDNVGYEIGKKMGPALFKKEDGILFRKEYIKTAEDFYQKHGGKTIVIARFTPIVRTFAPVVAGASNMPHRRFFFFNVIGGTVWGGVMILLGYFVGNRVPWLDKYMDLVIFGVVFLSLAISIAHVLKDEKTRAQLKAKAKHHTRRIFKRDKSS